jgi:hypothetical protein
MSGLLVVVIIASVIVNTFMEWRKKRMWDKMALPSTLRDANNDETSRKTSIPDLKPKSGPKCERKGGSRSEVKGSSVEKRDSFLFRTSRLSVASVMTCDADHIALS